MAKLALDLFDQLECFHGIQPRLRDLLWAGARLHDIGWRDGRKGHHKTSRDLILQDRTLPLSRQERALVAAVARYHRKALPKASHPCLGGLEENDRRSAIQLASLVRLCDGLDRTHQGRIDRVHCRASDGKVHLRCFALGPVEEEQAAAEKKSDLFQQTFAVCVKIRTTALHTQQGRKIPAG